MPANFEAVSLGEMWQEAHWPWKGLIVALLY